MNSRIGIFILALAVGAGTALYLKGLFIPEPQLSKLKLQEVLSIKELHLVKHQYQDLFFLHRKNKPEKSIRAAIQVPVSIVAYINLKEIKWVMQGDSIKKVILPVARLEAPVYELDKMIIHKTRSVQLHAGRDLYPEVSRYLIETLRQRMDTIRAVAHEIGIQQQAEVECKEYMEGLLRAVGRPDIVVSFGDASKDREILSLQRSRYNKNAAYFKLVSLTGQVKIVSY
jgi:hypothetical protein